MKIETKTTTQTELIAAEKSEQKKSNKENGRKKNSEKGIVIVKDRKFVQNMCVSLHKDLKWSEKIWIARK